MVPVVETERLRLRGFRASDFERWAEVMADPAVVRHLGGQALGREDTWRRTAASTGAWLILGFGYWAIERKADGRFVGQVGFADSKRDMTPSIEGLPEMGWIFSPEAQGRGYAAEAVAAGLDWIDAALRPGEVVAIIDPGNGASIRVAERAGFSEREDAIYKDERILLFRRRR